MRMMTIAAGLLGGALAASPAAFAGPVTAGSEFNIIGFATFDGSAITFANPASSGSNTGNFAAFGDCSACVTMASPFTYDPFTPGVIYTATNGGVTTTFTVTSNVSITHVGTTLLAIVDEGTATLTGFDPVPGEWRFTANEGKLSGSFSATTLVDPASPVPEPASLGLIVLGLGMIGLGTIRRR